MNNVVENVVTNSVGGGEGMEDFVTALIAAGGIQADTLWAQVAGLAPILVAVFGFAFGIYILRRVIRKASHGKAGI